MKVSTLQKIQRTLSLFKSVNQMADQMPLVQDLGRELDGVDSGDDVLEADRVAFSRARGTLTAFGRAGGVTADAFKHIQNLKGIVDRALAAPVPPAQSQFPTVKDAALRTLLERDLNEAENLDAKGFYKSSSVMAGSVLEALLYEYLLRNPAWTMDPTRAAIPKKRGGVPKPITSQALDDQWSLQDLIEFSAQNGLIKSYDARALHSTLRDPRNFIHPMKEIRVGVPINEHMSAVSLNMIKAIIHEFAALPDPQ